MVATSILFSRSFEIFLIAALAVITVLLFTGNGSFMLKSKNSTKTRTAQLCDRNLASGGIPAVVFRQFSDCRHHLYRSYRNFYDHSG